MMHPDYADHAADDLGSGGWKMEWSGSQRRQLRGRKAPPGWPLGASAVEGTEWPGAHLQPGRDAAFPGRRARRQGRFPGPGLNSPSPPASRPARTRRAPVDNTRDRPPVHPRGGRPPPSQQRPHVRLLTRREGQLPRRPGGCCRGFWRHTPSSNPPPEQTANSCNASALTSQPRDRPVPGHRHRHSHLTQPARNRPTGAARRDVRLRRLRRHRSEIRRSRCTAVKRADRLQSTRTPGTPEQIIAKAWDHLDPTRPIAVLVVALLHFISDKYDPGRIIRELVAPLAAGSYPGNLPGLQRPHPQAAAAIQEITGKPETPAQVRSHAEVTPSSRCRSPARAAWADRCHQWHPELTPRTTPTRAPGVRGPGPKNPRNA